MIVAPVVLTFLLCAFLPFAHSDRETALEELEQSIKDIDEVTKENEGTLEEKELDNLQKMKEDAIKLKTQLEKQGRRRRGRYYNYYMRQARSLNRVILRNLRGHRRKKKRMFRS